MAGSGLTDVLAGIGGGIRGGMAQYSWDQEFKQRERQNQSRTEVETLKIDLREMIAQLADQDRDAALAEKQRQFDNVSGNTSARIEGQNDRASLLEGGRNNRYFNPSGNAVLGAETTRRGQDMTFDLGVTRDGTTRRGQDLGFKLGTIRDTTTQRGQQLAADTAANGQAATTERTKLRGAMAGTNFYGPPAGQAPVTPTPPPQVGPTPVTPTAPPRAAAPAPRPATPPANTAGDQAEAARLIAAFDAEKDPKKKAELQKQMSAVLARLRGGGR